MTPPPKKELPLPPNPPVKRRRKKNPKVPAAVQPLNSNVPALPPASRGASADRAARARRSARPAAGPGRRQLSAAGQGWAPGRRLRQPPRSELTRLANARGAPVAPDPCFRRGGPAPADRAARRPLTAGLLPRHLPVAQGAAPGGSARGEGSGPPRRRGGQSAGPGAEHPRGAGRGRRGGAGGGGEEGGRHGRVLIGCSAPGGALRRRSAL